MPSAIHWMGSRSAFVGIGLAEEGEEKLDGPGGGQGQGEGVARAMAVAELAKEDKVRTAAAIAA